MTPFEIHHGDCIEVMRGMASASVDSICTDPPYELGFMGKTWDNTGIANSVEMWREALRVLKPGGHLLAFSGSRTYHRMTCAIEDAGFEVRDQIMWLYGSGFPKSMDVSKAIDRARTEDLGPTRVICRAVREAMNAKGIKSKDLAPEFGNCHPRLIDHWGARDTDSQPSLPTWAQWQVLRAILPLSPDLDAEVMRLNDRKGQAGDTYQNAEVLGHHEGATPGFVGERFNAPDTSIRERSEGARQWEGWGTALKPAHEPICVARKPLAGTVAANVLAHGTGAINIAGCRIGTDEVLRAGAGNIPCRHDEQVPRGREGQDSAASRYAEVGGTDFAMSPGPRGGDPMGRWPANIIHDGSDEVLAALPFSDSKGGGGAPKSGFWGNAGAGLDAKHADAGSAARFFYCAKTSRADRNEGCEALPQQVGGMVSNTSGQHMTRRDDEYEAKPLGNFHPTVKPTDLMAYLCRLVTPPGGTVLDPFMGSGSTGKACMREGFNFIGIDMTAEYIAIAAARIEYEQAKVAEAAALAAIPAPQFDLFESEAA